MNAQSSKLQMHKIKQAQSDPQFNKYSHDTRCLYACRQHFRGMKRHDSRCVCVCECRQPFRGMRQHVEVRQSGWCRALMISPCSCGSPASVRNLSSDSPATCSSSTRYTPAAALGCCLKTLPVWLLKTMITKNSGNSTQVHKKPLQRLTGHMQLINQVNPCCCSGLLPQKALNMGTEDITCDNKNNKILSSSRTRYTPAAPSCCLARLPL